MCGISGLVSRRPLSETDRRAVSTMNASLIHRGPDGDGEHSQTHAMLAMRRLSIIDLDGGWQPFFNGDKSLALVVNGEIYNAPELRADLEARGHRFRTGSDCEVILHLYEDEGIGCVDQLRGMFAFALWDERRQRLFLGRDRMGEKPLYLYESGQTLLFASELQTLVASGRVPVSPDFQSVDRYFHYGFVPEPETALAGVRKLPAAHIMTVDVREWRVDTVRYWDMKNAPPLDTDPAETVGAALDDVFKGVIRADTPVGVALSGGIDSSAIAAFCVRKGLDVSAFSVGYPGTPRSDERPQAKSFADRLGIPFFEVELGTAEMIADFPKIAVWRDDPIADISGYGYYSVSRLAQQQNVPVILQGQGADELFWGYDWTVQAVRESADKDAGRSSRLPMLIDEIRRAIPRTLSRGEIGHLLRSAGGVRSARERWRRSRLSPPERLCFYDLAAGYRAYESARHALMTDWALARQGISAAAPFTVPKPWDELETIVTDLLCGTYLRENGITQGDRLSMRSSVEMRLPFVDHKFVETVVGLRKARPDSHLGLKSVLKDSLRDVLPAEIVERRKRGFAPPVTEWRAGLLNAYGEIVSDGVLVEQGFFRRDAARRMSGANSDLDYESLLAFRALAFEKWYEGVAARQPAETTANREPAVNTSGRRIAVAMTCFNRRETTLSCLRALSDQELPDNCALDVYLTDDGCSDGTADAVRSEFPDTRILQGDGNLYWNGGMRRALAEAMTANPDFFLWLNDDTLLAPDAIARLLETYDEKREGSDAAAIIVGTPANPDGGAPVYGGTVRRHSLRPMRFTHVVATDAPVRCDTFDGNCVLVSAAAATTLGNLDSAFTHLMGDTDYGLRAGKAGIPIWISPGTVGICPRNPAGLRHKDFSLSLGERIAWLTGIKALRLKEWKTITRRHAGRLWMFYFLSPYIRFAIETAMMETKVRVRRLSGRKKRGASEVVRFATIEAVVPEYRMAFFESIRSQPGIQTYCFHSTGQDRYSVEPADRALPVESRPVVNRRWPGGGPRVAWQSGLGTVFAGRYDVVMCFETAHNLSVWAVLFLKHFGGYRVVLRGHGLRRLRHTGWREPIRFAMRKVMARMADALVVYSPRCAEDTVAAGIAREKIFVGDNTLDTEGLISISDTIVQTEPHFREHRRDFTLLFVGRLYSRKRLDVLLQAIRLLHQRNQSVRTIIVGEGQQRNTLEDDAAPLPNITFHGAEYDKTVLARLMNQADLMVIPDAVGLAAVHGFCHSLPILTAKHGQSHGPEFDYIEHGKNGVLAEDLTAECFAAEIQNLIARPEYVRSLRSGALTTAKSLSMEQMVQGTVDAIRYADQKRKITALP